MRRIPVRELRPGMMLARAVHNERGELLLNAAVPLSERYIQLLFDRGYPSVYVEDSDTADVEIDDIISERVRLTVSANLCRLYEAMDRAVTPYRDASHATIEAELQSPDFARAVQQHSSFYELQEDVEQIVEEVLAAEVLTGINTIRTFDSYQFIHALDSTATAVMLGRRLHYSQDDLKRLAAGCLLHDIGMVLVDRSILDKRGRLTPDEWERVRRHPQLGYEMLRKLRPTEVLANHVAFQHHERQDGTGYPRGLHGNNRIARTLADRSASGRIFLDAEIIAVADAYDALGADRPFRGAYAADQVVRSVRTAAGSQFNREIVQQLLSVVPVFPLGSNIVVMAGEHGQYRGIVVRVHREALDRPTIRLLFDPHRQRIEPIEIDLRTTDAVIGCIPFGD